MKQITWRCTGCSWKGHEDTPDGSRGTPADTRCPVCDSPLERETGIEHKVKDTSVKTALTAERYRLFIKVGKKEQLDRLAEGGGGYMQAEVLVTRDFDGLVVDAEKPYYVELEYTNKEEQAK